MKTLPPVRRTSLKSIRRILPPFEENPGIFLIRVGGDAAEYFITPIPADFGRGFLVEKMGTVEDGAYHVNLDGRRSSCECRGFTRHGYCKHVQGLGAAVRAGKL